METRGNELDDDAATSYRAFSDRVLYVSMDRPEISFAAQELCRYVAHPTKVGVEALKQAARFFVGLHRLVWNYPF